MSGKLGRVKIVDLATSILIETAHRRGARLVEDTRNAGVIIRACGLNGYITDDEIEQAYNRAKLHWQQQRKIALDELAERHRSRAK